MDAESRAALAAAEPQVISGEGAELADVQHRVDAIGKRADGPQRVGSPVAGDEVLGLDLVAARARGAVEAEVRQARRPRTAAADRVRLSSGEPPSAMAPTRGPCSAAPNRLEDGPASSSRHFNHSVDSVGSTQRPSTLTL
ncbi:MAG: hypothetical protein IPJ61_17865 [Tessaracoccus sp.]|uniref:hypothetical protein n=1 Tax=Tessaracoccus sp. TaxID=1971211 RepID=UPI001EC0F45A|nr:hypothetical protein [Tessaracoccus sp.]MBK7822871.1 hypothetical protein [Tessaracoccus sp.]